MGEPADIAGCPTDVLLGFPTVKPPNGRCGVSFCLYRGIGAVARQTETFQLSDPPYDSPHFFGGRGGPVGVLLSFIPPVVTSEVIGFNEWRP